MLRKGPRIPSSVVETPGVMSGQPCVQGTRVLAMTIVDYIRAGETTMTIFEDYPYLPVDAVEAVKVWADETLGPGWAEQAPI